MKRLRVFIVDDDRDFAESLAEVVELRGHRVQLAFSGEEAVRGLQETDFDIAFMDVRLPGLNGVECFLEVRRSKPDAKVVMMTGYSVQRLVDQAVAHGAWGVLHKPFGIEAVLEAMATLSPQGVLIADDNEELVESLRELLEQNGHRVSVARDGREAIERVLSGDDIGALLLDLRLPVLSGLEVYLELKEAKRTVPTVILTAYPREEAAALRQLRSLSVSDVLTKPFDPGKLLQVVDGLVPRVKE